MMGRSMVSLALHRLSLTADVSMDLYAHGRIRMPHAEIVCDPRAHTIMVTGMPKLLSTAGMR
jgi:predicted nucleotidyltransferase